MYTPVIEERVRITNTTHKELDGQTGTVVGVYGGSTTILLFDKAPAGYNPAMVIVNACLEKE